MEIIGLIVGLLGIVPFLFEIGKYYRILLLKFTKKDFRIESVTVTFDVSAPNKIISYSTARYTILKNDPILVLPFTNKFGDTANIEFYIDNVKIFPKITKHENDTFCSFKITNKEIGETIQVDTVCLFLSEPLDVNKHDGLSFWVDIYPVKYLKLQINFPEFFTPSNLSFAERPADFTDTQEISEKFGAIKTPFLYSKNRKAVEWLVDHPKFGKAYRIGWDWQP